MNSTIMQLVWDAGPTLHDSELIVMLALAANADDDGTCSIGMPQLSARARLSKRGSRYVLRKLADKEFIYIEERRGRTRNNTYYINLQNLQQLLPVLQVLATDVKPATVTSGFIEQNLQNLQQPLQVIEELKPAKPEVAVAGFAGFSEELNEHPPTTPPKCIN